VMADKTTKENVALLLMPGQVADVETDDDAVVSSVSVSDEKPVQLTAPSWIFLGLTAVSAATAVAFGLNAKSKESEVLDGYNSDTMIFKSPRSVAIDAQQSATFCNVAWGVAAASAAASTLFLVLDFTRKEDGARVSLSPILSPSSPGVAVQGAF
jgi:hypothetical protein